MKRREDPTTEQERTEEMITRLQETILQRKHPDEQVEFGMTRKNNGLMLHSCTVRYGDRLSAPTLYLEHFLKEDNGSIDLEKQADELLEVMRRSREGISLPDDFFERYEDVIPHLGIRLINRQQNEDLLREAAYVAVEDLAATFFYLLEDPVMGSGTIRVGWEQLRKWGITPEQILKDAAENSLHMLPLRFCSLSAMYGFPERGKGEIFVLTNDKMVYGASVILYPQVLAATADALEGDLWLIPSSVHEFLFMVDRGEEADALQEIVQEVNRTTVQREDYLSDSVYRFRRDTGRIERVC